MDNHDLSKDLADLFSQVAASDDDEKHLVVWRGKTTFVMMNLYPYNNGHLMVVPFRSVAQWSDLTPEERHEIADVIGLCQTWLDQAMSPEGYNVGLNIGKAAGAGIPGHLHVHVVPRWSGDTNFMPTVADVNVVPQAIQDTYDRLRRIANDSS